MPAASQRVAVVSLGGTIATVPGEDGRAGVVIGLSPEDLVAAVPGLSDTGIALDLVDLRRLPGASVTFDDVRAAAEQAEASIVAGAHGVVVTQGTDTIEETSFLLDLLWTNDAPIVVTGAMRYPVLAGADGPANLLAAVQVAASDAARGLGCLVVMSNEVHAARWVRKTHSVSPGAFASPATGPVGYVIEGRPQIWWRRPRRTHYATVDSRLRIALVTVGLGDDGELLRGIEDRFAGLVVAGFGAGHVPDTMVERLEQLSNRIPVVLASRTGAGPVLRATYGFPGSESDLQDRGLIGAGMLDAYKARILLQVLLSCGAGDAEIRSAFRSF